MRVLLISPYKIDPNVQKCLGLGYISSYLRALGHTTRIVEVGCLVRNNFHKIVKSFNPEIVGISVWCGGYFDSLNCAEYFRKITPNAKIVAGGPLGSFIQEELLATEKFDYVISGPGEIAMGELLEEICNNVALPGINIQGVSLPGFCNDRGFGKQIQNLDDLPFPDHDPDSDFSHKNILVASRGCKGNCIFCVTPMMTRPRTRSVNSVMSEMNHLMTLSNSSEFVFEDENMAVNPEYTYELCVELKKNFNKVLWSCMVRADIDHELLKVMKDAGCQIIAIGVESGNNNVLKKISKKITLEQIENTIHSARKLNMHVVLCYMIGHYCDSISTMSDTLEHASRMAKDYNAGTRMSCNTPFPGSYQYNNYKSLGITLHAKDWDDFNIGSPSISAKDFSLKDLRETYWQGVEIQQASKGNNFKLNM